MRMRRIFALACALLVTVQGLMAWGQKGHDVVARIAERHLSPAVAARVAAVLDGKSPVYWANWMDQASHTPEYAGTLTWHYVNIPEGGGTADAVRPPEGDLLTAVGRIVAGLKGGRLSPDEEAVALRMLVHLLGDMHCPMHTGRPGDRGGNDIAVSFFGEPTNLHAVWDTELVEAAHRWSYTEWAEQIDRVTPAEQRGMAAGTPEQWVEECHRLCEEIYRTTPAGDDLSYDYVAAAAPLIERQLLRGGVRLARLLDEIYGRER